MPFEIIQGNLVTMGTDAIVNSANPRPLYKEGLDEAIHRAAGEALLAARQEIGFISPGNSAITPGFRLKAKYVIHTVGPVWMGGVFGEAKLLRRCYSGALELAVKAGCRSVAFPLISVNNYGFPVEKALTIATEVFRDFLEEHELRILLVLPNREILTLSEAILTDLEDYLRQNYTGKPPHRFQSPGFNPRMRSDAKYTVLADAEPEERAMVREACAPVQAANSLDELLANTDAGFSETLLKLIDQSGKKDSAIYTRANVSRQHFSKIRNNPDYRPTKATAIAFAIALELDLEQTRDLIGRAGYALTNSSRFDLIIMYFIRQGNYNIFDINAALFRFDQSLLGV